MTDRGWSEIYADVDGPPVRATEEPFREAGRRADGTAETVRVIATDLTALGRLDPGAFEGEAARALAEEFSEVNATLDGVPRVFGELAQKLWSHANQLERYRRDARVALARARVSWTRERAAAERQSDAADQAAQAGARLSAAEQQIRRWTATLESTPPDDAGYYVIRDRLRQAYDTAAAHRREQQRTVAQEEAARRERDQARAELDYWRRGPGNDRSWQALRDGEDALNRTTAREIAAINLGALADPGLFERAWGAVADWTVGVQAGIAKLVERLGDVDWYEFWSRFDRVLTTVALVLTVALVVLVAIKFAPFLLAGAAGWKALFASVAGKATLGKVAGTAMASKSVKAVHGAKLITDAAAVKTSALRYWTAENTADRREAAMDYQARRAGLAVGGLAAAIGGRLVPVDAAGHAVVTTISEAAPVSGAAERASRSLLERGSRKPTPPLPYPSLVLRSKTQRVRTAVPSDLGPVTPHLCEVGR